MQNVRQKGPTDAQLDNKDTTATAPHDIIIGNITSTTSTPQPESTNNSTPTKSETETFSENPRFMSEASESDEESVSEVESFMIDQEFEDDPQVEAAKFLLNPDEDRTVDPETQARLEALLQAAGIGQLTSKDGKALGDPEVLRRLTSSVSCALDEAAAALTRMRSDNQGGTAQGAQSTTSQPTGSRPQTQGGGTSNSTNSGNQQQTSGSKTSLVEACTDGDVGTVRKLLTEGRSVHETSEEGESLLSLACSAGYFELAQVLLAMHANVEDRGIKGECTPLMEAASAGHLDIVKLLVHHGADVNAQSTSGNTPLMYACAGGHTEVVKFLLENGANVEDHNENGHTPLMEAASAGHVGLAKILLQHGAGINTHSNEFKESALTLACYKGHLDMVRFLLEAGADQEHKTDEMHTALMEASMDGHVEVARLLLDSGAQVNMPTDSFESPLTLAACGGHVDLAMLLIERGANIEEVNDEGYTPLMEAAREGHEEMVHLLLGQGTGANINAQTDETQETALTLACCGGFTEVADILLKGGADIELGASTPLMEAAQEGHLDLVRFLLEYGANVNAQTQTSDTALTYACENGHTDVADLLLQYNADLEHESEGGRTPLMKACRAGHLCTVQFLISKGANVRKQTSNNDHTPLSLACAGGHLAVVELLLQHNADPNHKLKDNSTMLIEAAKGGHTNVVQLLLDFPHSMQPIMFNQHGGGAPQPVATAANATTTAPGAPNLSLMGPLLGREGMPAMVAPANGAPAPQPPLTAAILQEVPEAVRIAPLQVDLNSPTIEVNNQAKKQVQQRSVSPASEVSTPPLSDFDEELFTPVDAMEFLKKEDPSNTLIDYIKNRKKFGNCKQKEQILEELNVRLHINKLESQWVQKYSLKKHDPELLERTQKRAILEELHRVEQELHAHNKQSLATVQPQQPQPAGAIPNVFHYTIPHEGCPGTQTSTIAPLNFDLTLQQQKQGLNMPLLSNTTTMGYAINTSLPGGVQQQQAIQVPYFTGLAGGTALPSPSALKLTMGNPGDPQSPYIQPAPPGQPQPAFYFAPLGTSPAHSGGLTAFTSQTSSVVAGTNVITAPAPGLGTLVPTSGAPLGQPAPPHKFTTVAEVSQSTAINDRPKVKPIKKEGKNLRKQQQQAVQQQQSINNPASPQQPLSNNQNPPQPSNPQQTTNNGSQQVLGGNPSNPQQPSNMPEQQVVATNQQQVVGVQQQQSPAPPKTFNLFADQQVNMFRQLQLPQQPGTQPQQTTIQFPKMKGKTRKVITEEEIDVMPFLKEDQQIRTGQETLLTTSILQQFHNSLQAPPPQQVPNSPQKTRLEAVYDPAQDASEVTVAAQKLANLEFEDFQGVDDVVQTLEVQPYPTALDENMIASLTAAQQVDLQAAAAAGNAGDMQRVEYFAVPTSQGAGTAQVPVHALYPYDYLVNAGVQEKQVFQAGFQAGYLMQQRLTTAETMAGQQMVPAPAGQQAPVQQQQQQQPQFIATQPLQQNGQQQQCGHIVQPQQQPQHPTAADQQQSQQHHCQLQPQTQQPAQQQPSAQQQLAQQQFNNHVQAATQTSVPMSSESKKIQKVSEMKFKRGRPVKHHNNESINIHSHYKIDHNSAITQYNTNQLPCPNSMISPCMDVDSETESNHDTALTLACAGGHEELVELLISRGADIEHRDKKGFTPLILAATAGHEKVVEILLNNNADIEAQSERTKDTPLSLACSGGRYEVVELLLNRGANKEHRNVSDYTPLSLAASGGYVNIIKLLLSHAAEINSRTGSKLGISPLMLAAMNGHTAAVKLLLDMGSDINAQIETNRNTALTLACFQGRHEVVSLLLDRKANVEHRAKTGLTPLMEAASGGYVDVGRVLLDKGADVNATPVPSSRDTALTIAADKGHVRFVELLLVRGAQVEVKNKKGNSPLWLAANGGHLPVVEMLYKVKADIDSQDNRKVSCLMAAFRKGHVKVVKWMVLHVTQFPSDQEMMRYIATISDKELLEKCHECVKIIRAAKETQAARANKNATILLEELESEKSREESKKLAAAKRRERKKKKRLEKKEERRKLLEENKKNENYDDKDSKKETEDDDEEEEKEDQVPEVSNTPRSEGVAEEGDSGIDANSQGSCSSNDIKTTKEKRKNKKNKKSSPVTTKKEPDSPPKSPIKAGSSKTESETDKKDKEKETKSSKPSNRKNEKIVEPLKLPKSITFEPSTKSPADRDDFEATGCEIYVSSSKLKKEDISPQKPTTSSPKSSSKREEGWKEVVRKSSVQTVSESGVKKVSVPLNAISRVIGRGGSNINAIRAFTGAHIEVEKQGKGQGERIITIKGSGDTTKQAYSLITALIKDPEMDIMSALSKTQKVPPTTTTLWDKTQIATKKNAGKVNTTPAVTSQPMVSAHPKTVPVTTAPTTTQVRFTTFNAVPKSRTTVPSASGAPSRGTAPRLVAQAEKIIQAQAGVIRMPTSTAAASRPTPAKVITTSANQTFAAKLTESSAASTPVTVSSTTVSHTMPSTANQKLRAALQAPQFLSSGGSVSPQPPAMSSVPLVQRSPTKTARPPPTGSAPPLMQQTPVVHNPPVSISKSHAPQQQQLQAPIGSVAPQQPVQQQPAFGTLPQATSQAAPTVTTSSDSGTPRVSSATPNPALQAALQQQQEESNPMASSMQPTSEYTLFYTSWNRRDAQEQKPVNFAAATGGAGGNQAVGSGHKFIDQDPPPQADASKAPGYRGGVSMCSPVSSKTSSSSTTPPNMANNNSFGQNFQESSKPQNPLPPIGSRPQVSQSQAVTQSTQDFMNYMDINNLNKAAANLLSNFNNDPLLQSSFNPIQGLNFTQQQQQGPVNLAQNTNMSRLNPKAPEYSGYSNPMQNKSTPHVYNGYQQQMNVPQQANMFAMKGMDNYHRGNMAGSSSSQNRSWMQMPQPFTSQSEQLISGLAGMTIQNLQAKFHSAEQAMENGAELGMGVHNSPNMSPGNMSGAGHGMHPETHFGGIEDRKPQPIGTERARKAYSSGMEAANWALNSDKTAKWGTNLADYTMRPQQMYPDDVIDFPRPIQMDNFMNQPPFVNYQQPMGGGGMGGGRHDYMPEMPKLPDMWGDSGRPLSDLQDKPHGWTNQWNK